jgi:hypothetical protein
MGKESISSTSISSMTQSVVIPCKVPGACKRMSVNLLRTGFAVAVLYRGKTGDAMSR